MKKIFHLFGILLFAVIVGTEVYAQDPAQYGTPFGNVADPRDANIYQVAVGEFSSSRNLQGVTNGLDKIKALGINVIYLMPIYPLGVLKASGSPYSIQNLTGINSKFGTLADLQNLVAGAHSRGMAVILDWVANQTSWDHAWITAHKDYYQQDASGNILQAGTFPDCAALNYNSSAMTSAMISAMRYWIFAANVDGFRCDWADNAPKAYWTSIITNLRGITSHKLLMLAEGSNDGTNNGCNTCGQNQPGYHYAEGFDFIFGENFYWNFTKKVFLNGEPATNVDGINIGDYTGASSSQLVARYVTNHDEYGSEGSPYSWLGGKNQVLADFVIASYMHGTPFIYNGLEVGNTSALTYPWTATDATSNLVNWTQDVSITPVISQILAIRNSSDAIRRGTLTSYTNTDIVAFTKTSGSQTVFVAVNVRNASKTFTLPSGIANTSMFNAFTNSTVNLGSSITLSAYQYLTYTNAAAVSVTGISVSPATTTIAGTGTQQLTATVIPSNASNKNVTWTSNNTAVATVSSTGLITGVSQGTATITVKTVDQNKTANCALTIASVAVTGVSVSPASASLTNGGTQQLSVTIVPSNASNKSVIWTSSNTAVATVSFTGLVTGVASGTATITVKTTDGSKTATCVISENNISVTGVTISPTSVAIGAGSTQQLTANVVPANASNKNVMWTSSNTAIASVNSNGLVTAFATGTATITVKTNDGLKTATCSITVSKMYYTIKNRWKNTYLYDAGSSVGYGTTVANNNYLWDKQTIDATYFWLKNLGTGEYMHIQDQTGKVQCTPLDVTYWSGQWSADYIDGTWIRLRNRWITSDVVHVEDQNGFAEYANEQDGWYSAQWQLGNVLKSAFVEQKEPNSNVMIYPNPANDGFVNITIPEDFQNCILTIYDMEGRKVHELELTGSNSRVNLPSLKNGVYIIRISSLSAVYTQKLIIKI